MRRALSSRDLLRGKARRRKLTAALRRELSALHRMHSGWNVGCMKSRRRLRRPVSCRLDGIVPLDPQLRFQCQRAYPLDGQRLVPPQRHDQQEVVFLPAGASPSWRGKAEEEVEAFLQRWGVEDSVGAEEGATFASA